MGFRESINIWGASQVSIVHFVMCDDMNKGTARLGFTSPFTHRTDTTITEEAKTYAVPLQYGWRSGLIKVHSGSCYRHPQFPKSSNCIFYRGRTLIPSMIAGKGNNIESGRGNCLHILGWSRTGGAVHICKGTISSVGKKNLSLPNYNVARFQHRSRQRKDKIATFIFKY